MFPSFLQIHQLNPQSTLARKSGGCRSLRTGRIIPVRQAVEGEKKNKKKTYNTGDSLVVTDPTTNPALSGLTRGERTGSRAFQMVWSYVKELRFIDGYNTGVHETSLSR